MYTTCIALFYYISVLDDLKAEPSEWSDFKNDTTGLAFYSPSVQVKATSCSYSKAFNFSQGWFHQMWTCCIWRSRGNKSRQVYGWPSEACCKVSTSLPTDLCSVTMKADGRCYNAFKLFEMVDTVNNVFPALILSSWVIFLYLLYILCLSICSHNGRVNKGCFVDVVLLSCDHHIFLWQRLSSWAGEEGRWATAARLEACVSQPFLPLSFFQFHS